MHTLDAEPLSQIPAISFSGHTNDNIQSHTNENTTKEYN